MIAIILFALPANYFDSGNAMCLSVLIAKTECYGCGMTRAIQHLIHGELKEAYDFNKLSFIVFPLFVSMMIWEFIKRYNHLKKSE
jgi:hypothetical protein